MTEIIIGIIAIAMINFTIKAIGPAVLGDREPSPAVQELITAMAPALLAGLVTVQLLGPRWGTLDWTALPGLVAAALAYRRGLPDLVCIAVAVVITVVLRLLV
jgi:branched-subunit amino acid transport protein AzlD